jgi:hypothetical protein
MTPFFESHLARPRSCYSLERPSRFPEPARRRVVGGNRVTTDSPKPDVTHRHRLGRAAANISAMATWASVSVSRSSRS